MIAAFIVNNNAVYYYAPVLIISGIVTGLLIGYLTSEVLKRIRPEANGGPDCNKKDEN